MKAFILAEQRVKDLNAKLTEAITEKKSAKATLEGAERQVEIQRQQLRQTKDQLSISKEQIGTLKRKLAKAEKAIEEAEQEGYDIGVAKTEENLRAQVSGICRGYCLKVWNEALNQAKVDASSTLRREKNFFYPLAILALGPSSSKAESAPKDPDLSKDASASALPSSTFPSKEVGLVGATKKEKDTTKEVVPEPTKLPPSPKEPSKEKGVS